MWVIAGRKTTAGGWAQRWSPPAQGEMVGLGRRKPSCKALRGKMVTYWTCRRQRGRCPGCLGRWSCHSQEERYKRRARPEAWLTFLLPQTALFFPQYPTISIPSRHLQRLSPPCPSIIVASLPELCLSNPSSDLRSWLQHHFLRGFHDPMLGPMFARPGQVRNSNQAPADCSLALCSLCSPAL